MANQRRPFPDQGIAAGRPRILWRAGTSHDLAPLFQREAGRDQAAGPGRSLDQDDAPREARDKAVSTWEMLSERRDAERDLCNQQALVGDLLGQSDISPGG